MCSFKLTNMPSNDHLKHGHVYYITTTNEQLITAKTCSISLSKKVQNCTLRVASASKVSFSYI